MISKKLEDAINNQINKELYSEYLYLSMAAYFYSEDLDGFAHWMEVQAQEEHTHAMKFFYFLNDKGGRVKLEAIEKPEVDFVSVESIFEKTLEHEKKVTKLINDLMDLAIEENEHSVKSFLNWFVDEQVEEEDTAGKLLSKVKMIGKNTNGLLMLDKELAQRK
jgi:ferritin